jgi:hypothetical protein
MRLDDALTEYAIEHIDWPDSEAEVDALLKGSQMAEQTEKEMFIKTGKQYRKDLDEVLQRIKGDCRTSRERSLCVTKVQEAIMWLGMDLKALNDGVSCYSSGYDPTSAVVEPTADGVKF